MKWIGTFVVGILIGAAAMVVFRPAPRDPTGFGPEAVWRLTDETSQRVFECGTTTTGRTGETRCAVRVMERAGASEEAQEFFRQTHWFLQAFRESGVVDLGSVVVPWRANANDDYLLLNGSPSAVLVEAEAPVIALFGQDPAYEPLREAVNRTDDVPEADDLVLWETDEVFESVRRARGRTAFVFQWALKDGCHACDTGYAARVALEFARDGTYLAAEPLSICRAGEPAEDVGPIDVEVPECPATGR